MTTPRRTAWAIALWAALHSSAGAITPQERDYLGGYTSSSVDAQSQLMLLDDNSFCFRFMGGALDMMAAGRWKALPGADGVRLQEVRLPQPQFPAYAKPAAGKAIVFDFHGYTLGEALAPVFGVSATAQPPSTLRPLFGHDDHSWAESYKLEPMPAASARYFYIGQVEQDARGKPLQLRVVQYRLPTAQGGAGTVRIGFNTLLARPALDMVARLKDGMLIVDGQRFGARDELSPELVDGIRNACVDPVLSPGKARPPATPDDEAPTDTRPPMVPIKTLVLPLSSVQGAAYFHLKGD